MIKAIAIDDEPLALKIIEYYCSSNDKIDLLKTFSNQEQALDFLKDNSIDLIFLDIHMPQKNGIDFYKDLDIFYTTHNNTCKPSVIFTTAHSEYALDGFEVNAIDYLVKPIDQERFDKSIEKTYSLAQNLLLNNKSYITIRADYKNQKVQLSDILYIEGLDDYIQFYFLDRKKIVSRMSMKGILEKLPENNFIRIHRSYIINIDKVDSYDNKNVYINDKVLPIGETFKIEVAKKLF